MTDSNGADPTGSPPGGSDNIRWSWPGPATAMRYVSGVFAVVGGTSFLFAAVFLLSGILMGRLDTMFTLSPVDARRVLYDVYAVNRLLVFSGMLFLLGFAVRMRQKRWTGLALLGLAVAAYFVVPAIVFESLGGSSQATQEVVAQIVRNFGIVGIASGIAALPFLLLTLSHAGVFLRRLNRRAIERADIGGASAGLFWAIPNYCTQVVMCIYDDLAACWMAWAARMRRIHLTIGLVVRITRQCFSFIYWVAGLFMIAGGTVFLLSAVYLMWVLLNHRLDLVHTLPQIDAQRILQTFYYVNKVMLVGGIAFVISMAIRLYNGRRTGYGLLIFGVLLYWGLPLAFYSILRVGSASPDGGVADVVWQFRNVGLVSMIASLPFVVLAFWRKVSGTDYAEDPTCGPGATIEANDRPVKSRIRYQCWDLDYCRLSLRRYCRAYAQRTTCWRLKNGCQCDDDTLLRVMNRKNPNPPEHPRVRRPAMLGACNDGLTDAQRRARCRKCGIYEIHQRQKYRIAGQLVFPAIILIEWLCYDTLKAWADWALTGISKLASDMSFTLWASNADSGTKLISNAADIVILVCLGLFVATVLLRVLEYLILELGL